MKRNPFVFGLLLGLVLPILAHVLTKNTHIVDDIMPQKPLGLYVLAVTGNMIGVWYTYSNQHQQIGMGVVLATFLSMLLAVVTKVVVL